MEIYAEIIDLYNTDLKTEAPQKQSFRLKNATEKQLTSFEYWLF